jgi:hypothetical protein
MADTTLMVSPPRRARQTPRFTPVAKLRILVTVWYVNKPFEGPLVDSLPSKGFTVQSSGGVVRVEKYGCGSELRRLPDGGYQMTELPTIMAHGQFTQLWDAGYQKFLLTKDHRKIPATAKDLGSLRRFNEELRSTLGVVTYYNEALGSTCEITVYDRVKGRSGDVPDETVGVKPASGH